MKKNHWVISDPHLFHEKLAVGPRKFVSVKAMHDRIARRWRNTVKPRDIVLLLGDMAWVNSRTRYAIHSFFTTLPGYKVLIRGNHDKHGVYSYMNLGMDMVCDELVLEMNGYTILCCHRPKAFLREGIDGVFHGHIHSGREDSLLEAHLRNPSELTYIPPFNVNCCVEMTGYAPISWAHACNRLHQQLDVSRGEGT